MKVWVIDTDCGNVFFLSIETFNIFKGCSMTNAVGGGNLIQCIQIALVPCLINDMKDFFRSSDM